MTDQQTHTDGAPGTGSPRPEVSEDDQSTRERPDSEVDDETKGRIRELEEDPPARLEDWPDDAAKYDTLGGPEGDEGYDESVTRKLGPSSLRYRQDGSVEIEGKQVENPGDYKSDPIPGGPTDPRMEGMRAYGEPDLTEETSVDAEAAVGDGDSDDSGGR